MIKVPTYTNLSAVAQFYDAFIVDLWGVLHDGSAPYPGAIECLEQLREREKPVILLSNAPRPASVVAERLTELGIPDDLYGGIMTSGEEVRHNLITRDDPWYAELRDRVFLLGTDRDLSLLDGVEGELVDTITDADYVLLSGPMLGNSVEAHEEMLQQAFERRLRVICANPDLVVIHDGEPEVCAGALAKRYEEIGGEVRYHGKPYESVYESCLDGLYPLPYQRIGAIGDSLKTDMRGAANMGLPSLFITSGIHAAELGVAWGGLPNREKLSALFEAEQVVPRCVLTSFVW